MFTRFMSILPQNMRKNSGKRSTHGFHTAKREIHGRIGGYARDYIAHVSCEHTLNSVSMEGIFTAELMHISR